MNPNPFDSSTSIPQAKNAPGQFAGGPADAGGSGPVPAPAGGRLAAAADRRWIKGAVVGTAVFLVLLFIVYREVYHNHRLYEVNRLRAAEELQRREAQGLLRLHVAHEAYLEAELLRLESQSHSPQNIQTALILH